jgi:hypothetical protein
VPSGCNRPLLRIRQHALLALGKPSCRSVLVTAVQQPDVGDTVMSSYLTTTYMCHWPTGIIII